MTVLREYKQRECDDRGKPLDWERCRGFDELDGGMGSLHEAMLHRGEVCPYCENHGSLKAAALADFLWCQIRCEGCGHPISEGMWEHYGDRSAAEKARLLRAAESFLRRGQEPAFQDGVVHYSPCDEGCRHGGPGRVQTTDGWREVSAAFHTKAFGSDWPGAPIEASWRPVDVRTGRPAPDGAEHPMLWTRTWDLRPANLRVLCLRCWASQ